MQSKAHLYALRKNKGNIMNKCNGILLLIAFTILSPSLNAANISIKEPDVLFLDGEIEKEDFQKIINVVIAHGNIPSVMGITSSGGDLIEAMEIGRFIRKNHMPIVLIQPCDSACTFIVFAATKRKAGKLGLHRPYYDPSYFSKLSSEDARKEYEKLDKETRKYLIEMNVPTIIIDKIMSIPSSDVEYLPIETYNKLAGENPPAYNEWLASRCGTFSDRERLDFKHTSALMLIEEYPDAKLDPFAIQLYEIYAEEARKLSSEYRGNIYKKGRKILDCEKEAVEKERLVNFTKLVK